MTVATVAPYLLATGGRCWAWVALRITEAYDLSRRAEYARLPAADRLVRAVGEQSAYLDRLLGIPEGQVVALRLLHRQVGRLDAYLLGRAEGGTDAEAHARAVALEQSLRLVPEHVRVAPVTDPDEVRAVLAPFDPPPGGLAQVHKRVRIARPERIDAGVAAYAAVEPFGRNPQAWDALLEALRATPYPAALSIELAATTVPAAVRRMLETETTRYGRLAQPLQTQSDVGGQLQFPADGAARTIEPLYLDALRRYDNRVFRFAVTVAGQQPLDDALLELIGATVSPPAPPPDRLRPAGSDDPHAVPSGYETARPQGADVARLGDAFTTLQPTNWGAEPLRAVLAHDAAGARSPREALWELRLLVDRAEAASLFRLPLALEGHVPGFPVAAPPDRDRVVAAPTGPSLLLGAQPGGGEVRFAVDDLPRHGFIVGTPGSGKTNTALHVCRQLWPAGVPFAVVEPVNAALNDYRWLATLPEFDDLLVFTVGDDAVAPLRLNPFQVPDGGTVIGHISNLLACFEAAFGLWDPLPFLYRRAMVEVYRRRGFHADHRASPADVGRWPVLDEFVGAVTEVTEELGYAGEVGANIDAAARLRAEALAEGACGPTLNCRRSYDLDDLMRRPVVFELAGVGDNAKEQALVTLLLITAMRGWYRQHRRSADPPHVILLEEAHRVFPRATPQSTGDAKEANAQALAAERIAQGLAEDRKYRQSYLLIDQQVGKVAEDAYKITNLKVMHRTSAKEDRELLGATMATHADQLEVAATLRPFHALVSHNALDRAVSLEVPNIRAAHAREHGLSEAPLAADDALAARFTAWRAASPAVSDALAPYPECAGCAAVCQHRRRAESLVAGAEGRAAVAELFAPEHGDVGTPQWCESLPRRLHRLAGTSESTVDFYGCVFLHAFRTRYPARKWDTTDRDTAVGWAEDVRRILTGSELSTADETAP